VFKKPVIAAVDINIRVLVVKGGWRRRFWPLGLSAQRARSELTAAVVKHFQRFSQPEVSVVEIILLQRPTHLSSIPSSTSFPKTSCAYVTSAFWPTALKDKCCRNAANFSILILLCPGVPSNQPKTCCEKSPASIFFPPPYFQSGTLIVVADLPRISRSAPWDSS